MNEASSAQALTSVATVTTREPQTIFVDSKALGVLRTQKRQLERELGLAMHRAVSFQKLAEALGATDGQIDTINRNANRALA